MKIVVLDGYTSNPGDLSWDAFSEHGELVVYDRTPASEVVSRCLGASVVLTNKVVLDAEVIANLPDLKYIGVLATGYNVVDVAAAARSGISVCNVPGYSTDSVAQLVFAFILHFGQQVALHGDAVRDGDWVSSVDFCFLRSPLGELSGKTLGVVGFGGIGRRVCQIAQAFGMKVVVHNRTPREAAGIRFVPLEELLATSDYISLNCPLTDVTHQLINEERLALMKDSAVLVNTARGPLLDEAAVAAALHDGRLRGAGLDVLSSEPPAADNPLLVAPRCVITPHIGWATLEARKRLLDVAASNLTAFINGTPENQVS